MFDLTLKVALVAGSFRGNGEAKAWQMALAGARVAISSRHQESSDAVADVISADGLKAEAIASHVSDKS